MSFKSYGNVPNGVAVIQCVDTAKLDTNEGMLSLKWFRVFSGYISAKAARVVGDNVVVLLWGEGSAQASLVMLKGSDGSIIWGPTKYADTHGEGTDIAVSSDNSLIAISGQGGTSSPKVISARMTLVKASNGAKVKTLSYSVGATPNTVFHECWGVVAFPSLGGFAMACGTGIEGGTCAKLSGTD